MTTKISVVIPVYNTGEYLVKCLDSVCNQTLKDLEIIIVNDGSSDNSQDIIDDYLKKDNRIKSIVQQNSGLGPTRNAGMLASTSDYIVFVDSDDWIELSTCEEMLNVGEESQADIVVYNSVKIYSDGTKVKRPAILPRTIPKRELITSKFQFEYFIGRGYGVSACNKLYRLSFLRKNELKFEKNSEIFAEDLLFNLMCLLNKPFIVLTEYYFYNYYIRDNSIIQSYKPDMAERMANLISRLDFYIRKKGLEKDFTGLMAIMSFNAISICMYNAFLYSDSTLKSMRKELDYLIHNNVIKKNLTDIASGKILKGIDDLQWKVYARIFAILVFMKMYSPICIIQRLRFKKITSLK